MSTKITVRPILIWEQKNEEEKSSKVIPLFGEKTIQEDGIHHIVIQTDNQKIEITQVSSGFGKIHMLHGSTTCQAA